MTQLGDQGGLLELRDGTEDLADELGGRARVGEIARRVCAYKPVPGPGPSPAEPVRLGLRRSFGLR